MTAPDLDLAEPRVYLDPDDVSTVQNAGVAFAHVLAGAPSGAFMHALGEQQELIRIAVQRSGYGDHKARLAACEFSIAARAEWELIEPAFSGTAWGTA